MRQFALCMLAIIGLALIAGTSATGPPAEFTASAYYVESVNFEQGVDAYPVFADQNGDTAAEFVPLMAALLGDDGQLNADLTSVNRHDEGEQAREVVAMLAHRASGTHSRTMKAIYTGHDSESDRDLRRLGDSIDPRPVLRL